MRRIAAYLCLLCWVSTAGAQGPKWDRLWTVVDGVTTLSFDLETLEKLGLRVAETDETAVAGIVPGLALGFAVDPGSTFVISVNQDRRVRFVAGEVRHIGGISLGGWGLSDRLFDFGLSVSSPGQDGGMRLVDARSQRSIFDVSQGQVGWNPISHQLVIARSIITINETWAQELGRPELSGAFVGTLDSELWAEPVDPKTPVATEPSTTLQQGVTTGPDVTQCRQHDLRQWGRLGSIVGCALLTTSINVGDAPMDWFPNPQENHPFIAMNLYRLKDDRFEQIGQSWLKHGFFATNQSECGQTNCVYPGTGFKLGVGCTDTYGSGLNATQSGLGPRSEVNPWTGGFTYSGSHIQIGAGGHNEIDHRLQVHDDDLDATMNPGATYFSESYYVAADDTDHTNNIVWKEVTVSGAPLGTWTFGMSPLNTPPMNGPAANGWTGATRTTIGGTEEPVGPNPDSDGRCYVYQKVAFLGAGQYAYEYAIFNLDMERAIQSFSVPIPPGALVTNTGSHQVASHGEAFSNDPWTIVLDASSITFSCETFATDPNANALRWGTLYNFRFEADLAGGDVTATLGLFKPSQVGDPNALTGTVLGPLPVIPPLEMTAVSRLEHGSAGFFDLEKADGTILEHRLPGVKQLVIGFSEAVLPGSVAVSIDGLVSGAYGGTIDLTLAAGDTELIIDLDPPLADLDRHTVDLTGITSLAAGLPLQDAVFEVATLRGDVDRNGTVTTGDASAVRFFFSQTADSSNFPFDVDASGSITTGDFSQIRFFFNNTLP